MSLFTFSFRGLRGSGGSATQTPKLLQFLIASVVALAAYNVWLHLAPPTITQYQNQWVKNRAKAEQYLYAPTDPEVAIVGSSLAARLITEEIGPNAVNLAFASAGATTGIEIIKRSERYPKLILVETNKLEMAVESEMMGSLFTPVIWRAKRFLRFLQYHYQPSNILLSWVMQNFAEDPAAKRMKAPSPEIQRRETERQVEIAQDDSDFTQLDTEPLIDSLRELQNKGIEIVLFTMPVADEVMQSPRYRALDNLLNNEFADFTYWDIASAQMERYETTDGVHLSGASALAFSQELAERIALFK